MKKYIVFLFATFMTFDSFSQNNKRILINDTIPGWFRFVKYAHAISIMPTYSFISTPDQITQTGRVFVNTPGLYFVYNFFPIKRFSIGFNAGVSKSFSNKINSTTLFYPSIELKYYFYGNSRFFFYPYLDYGITILRGFSNTVYTYANPEGVLDNGLFYKKNYSKITYGAGIGLNILNNMSIQFHVARYYWLDEKFRTTPNFYHLGFYYHLNRKPQLPTKSIGKISIKKLI
jgi:hypothetical protein